MRISLQLEELETKSTNHDWVVDAEIQGRSGRLSQRPRVSGGIYPFEAWPPHSPARLKSPEKLDLANNFST